RPAEAGQLVAHPRPRRAGVEVDVRLRRPVDVALHVREHDVDPLRMVRRLAEERAPAGPAERPRAVVRGAGADRPGPARDDAEALVGHGEPGDVRGPVAAPAHRAVAVAAEERRRLDGEADRAAEAGAGDGWWGHAGGVRPGGGAGQCGEIQLRTT